MPWNSTWLLESWQNYLPALGRYLAGSWQCFLVYDNTGSLTSFFGFAAGILRTFQNPDGSVYRNWHDMSFDDLGRLGIDNFFLLKIWVSTFAPKANGFTMTKLNYRKSAANWVFYRGLQFIKSRKLNIMISGNKNWKILVVMCENTFTELSGFLFLTTQSVNMSGQIPRNHKPIFTGSRVNRKTHGYPWQETTKKIHVLPVDRKAQPKKRAGHLAILL